MTTLQGVTKRSTTAITLAVLLLVGLKSTAIEAARTVDDLVTDFRADIGEADSTTTDGGSRYTNTQVRRYLTRGQNIAAQVVGGVESDTTIVLVSNTRRYALPSDFYAIEAAYFLQAKDYIVLKRPDKFGLTRDSAAGAIVTVAPDQYDVFSDHIKIAPVSESYSADSLLVDYYGWPTALANNEQTPDLPEYTDEFVVDLAVLMAHKRTLSFAEYETQFTAIVARLRNIAEARKTGKPVQAMPLMPMEISQ